LEQLRVQGLDAAQISDVIITHAHFDHYSALSRGQEGQYEPSFPQARHYLSKADWHPEQFEDLEERTLRLVEQKGLLDLNEGVVDIGDGLTIMPMPGETPGHQILCLTTENREIYFAGDLYHHSIEFEDAALNVYWASAAEMRMSKTTLMKRAADNDGVAYFTHIPGPYRATEQNGETIVWESIEKD